MLGSCLAATLLWYNSALVWCNALCHVLGNCAVHDVMSYIMLLGAAAVETTQTKPMGMQLWYLYLFLYPQL